MTHDREQISPASILLVDDTPANLVALSTVLRPLGARIVEATSGPEALARVEGEPFAVALLDVQMPGMDGLETARRLRALENGRDLPIIFLTARGRDEAFAREGYATGAADLLTKPLDPDVVCARVRAFVSLYEQREQIRLAQVAIRTQERDDAVRRLVAFERIATAALQTPDLSEFLHELLSVFMSATGNADTTTVLLRDGDELRVHACVSLSGRECEHYSVPMGPTSFAGTVAASRRPLEIGDISASTLVKSEWLRLRGTKGLFGVPMLHDGEVLGVAYLGSVRSTEFSEADKRLFTAMAERAAWAVAEHLKRARVHDVLSAAPALIAILREEDNVHEFVNPSYASFFGRGDLVGRPLSVLGLESSLGDLASRARTTESTVSVDELTISGGRVLRATAKPLRAASGSVDSVVVFAIDVTAQAAARAERLRLLELERRARLDAEMTSRMKDEFLANVSHELRTPLNAILGWVIMARLKASPEVDRALAIVERNARAQARLIEDVLDVSRIVRGKLRVEPSEVTLNEMVEAALDAVRPAAQAKNISLCVLLPGRITLRADAHRLQQIVWNLLSNAIKFTAKGGRVEVEGTATDETATLRVTDSGEGIDPDFLAHVFEPFRQADGTTTRRHGGLGLGLAIVKQIVDAHGGTIRAMSEGAGKGATFVLEMPRAARAGAASTTARASEPAPPLRSAAVRLDGLRVLVVDDDEDTRSLLAQVLSAHGAATAEAESASRAFSELGRFRPDVLVSDIAMPGGDGYGLIRAVRALPEERGGNTPAIAVTAQARTADFERAFAAGFQGHLAKPVDLSELVSLIADLGGGAAH